ncbi:hypothetical protein Tco_0051128 [Tanacetum coccineum]
MVVLESCPKHNMVAYLEKTEGNAEFHEVIDFLARSSIHHALTVSPVVSTTFVKQFWMSVKSKIINNVRYITAKVAGKHVSISEASIRSGLLFDDEGDLTGKHFSGKVTPLFASMLVQSTKDEGATSERPSEPQPTPSPPHPSEENVEPQYVPSPRPSPTPHIPDVIPKGRKSAKAEPSVHKDPLFDELDDDEIDNMDTEDAQDVGRSRDVVNEEKENADAEVSTEDVLSTAQQKVSTDKEKVSTDRPKVSTDGSKVSTDKEKDSTDRTDEGTDDQTEGRRATQTTQTTTSTMFGDDETIAQVLLNMSQAKAVSREKEKGVEFKDVEETERPRPTLTRSLLTLKPLPKIDPKDKGKKKIEEEDESETESEEEERKRLAEEEATNDALIRSYDDIKARIEADGLLAKRLQEQEREQFTVEERAKFLHDTIATQRRFLAQQRSEAIRNKPPTKNQLRNQMMTYLKHVGNYQHSQLKTKKFEEIQALYEKIKRSDKDFIAIGSVEDERIEIMEKKSVITRLDKVSSPERVYLGDLKIMMESSTEENDQSDFWSNQQDWKIITWRLYEACRVCILELEDGIVIHMLVERRYPLSRELLQRMLDLGLEVERKSSIALDLIRFIKQQIDEE